MNPAPLTVVWAGPILGVLIPLGLWGIALASTMPAAFLLRFFAGFCLIANGLYIGIGSFDAVGDCSEMLHHGSESWQLWCFGAVTVPPGFWLWHGQGKWFGIGPSAVTISPRVAYGVFAPRWFSPLSDLPSAYVW